MSISTVIDRSAKTATISIIVETIDKINTISIIVDKIENLYTPSIIAERISPTAQIQIKKTQKKNGRLTNLFFKVTIG